jgi:transposase, IS5 family
MYRDRERQVTLQEDPLSFMGARLDPQNRWIQLVKLIPWMKIEEKYNQTFENAKEGNPAKSCRIAIGSLIIKERMQLSDRETVEMIAEHPYLQYFIGMDSFQSIAPFDASTMTMFRKRLTPEMMEDINQMIINRDEKDDPDDQELSGDGNSDISDPCEESESQNAGTIILDATCAPADIHYPTDVSLLNESREKLEELIDTLHDSKQGVKPRTYRENARRDYLRFVRSRKPRLKTIRKAIRQQLGYVRRDLVIVDKLLTASDNSLSNRQNEYLETIHELYHQQETMYKDRTHRIPDRIVSIHQPWVRPIVRGKATADVEFGAKISISMVDGYASIEKLDWDAYNESVDLMEIIERHKTRTGKYPERILADKIYRTRNNLKYCEHRNIRFNGPKLGRPPKDKDLYSEQKRLEKQESGERNAVEGKFGEGKRCYGLSRVMTRLKGTSVVSIYMTFIVMNLERKQRDIIFTIYRWLLHLKFSMPVSEMCCC